MRAADLVRRLCRKRATTRWLNIELSSRCNLRCKWCTLDHSKPVVFLDARILDKVLDEVVFSGDFALEQIDLHNAGESLLHPELGGLLEMVASKKRRAAGIPRINLLTNGVLLTEQLSQVVIASDALDLLRFSVDGGSAEAFEEIRTGAKWETVRDNILCFTALRKQAGSSIRTGIICIVPPDKPLCTDWMEPEFVALLSSVDGYELRHPHGWDGSKELGLPGGSGQVECPKGKICKFLVKNLVVLPDGGVTVCCADLNGRGVIGNVGTSSLYHIYAGTWRAAMLADYAKGRKGWIDLCVNCEGYYE